MACSACLQHRKAIKDAVVQRDVPRIVSTTVKAVRALSADAKKELVRAGFLNRQD